MKNNSIVLRLTVLGRALLRLVEQTCLLPRSMAATLKDRQRRIAGRAAEAERLDRIRNPSDYLGK